MQQSLSTGVLLYVLQAAYTVQGVSLRLPAGYA